MKILQIINSLLPGGAEKLVVDTSRIFSNQGLSVDILLLNGVETPLLKQVLKEDNVNVILLDVDSNIYNPKFIFKIKKRVMRKVFVLAFYF